MDKLAENIKILREKKGISQYQLAKELFVTRQAVARWENGVTRPDIETIGKLADIFGVSVEYLITGKEIVKEVVVEKEVEKEVIKEVPVEKVVEKNHYIYKEPEDYDKFKMYYRLRVWLLIISSIFYTFACLVATIVVLIADAELMKKLWVIWVFAVVLLIWAFIYIRRYINPNFLKRKNKRGDKKQ